jgi:hypothetical protein
MEGWRHKGHLDVPLPLYPPPPSTHTVGGLGMSSVEGGEVTNSLLRLLDDVRHQTWLHGLLEEEDLVEKVLAKRNFFNQQRPKMLRRIEVRDDVDGDLQPNL